MMAGLIVKKLKLAYKAISNMRAAFHCYIGYQGYMAKQLP